MLLRFPIAGKIDQATGQDAPWMPGLVELFVDDEFVGNALMNSQDGLPKLSLTRGDHTIRAEFQKSHLYSVAKVYERKITMLGHGSEQMLYIDPRPGNEQRVDP